MFFSSHSYGRSHSLGCVKWKAVFCNAVESVMRVNVSRSKQQQHPHIWSSVTPASLRHWLPLSSHGTVPSEPPWRREFDRCVTTTWWTYDETLRRATPLTWTLKISTLTLVNWLRFIIIIIFVLFFWFNFKDKMTLFLLFILLSIQSSHSVVTGQGDVYTNHWAVRITGGSEQADRIAAKYGYMNLGQVMIQLLFLLSLLSMLALCLLCNKVAWRYVGLCLWLCPVYKWTHYIRNIEILKKMSGKALTWNNCRIHVSNPMTSHDFPAFVYSVFFFFRGWIIKKGNKSQRFHKYFKSHFNVIISRCKDIVTLYWYKVLQSVITPSLMKTYFALLQLYLTILLFILINKYISLHSCMSTWRLVVVDNYISITNMLSYNNMQGLNWAPAHKPSRGTS